MDLFIDSHPGSRSLPSDALMLDKIGTTGYGLTQVENVTRFGCHRDMSWRKTQMKMIIGILVMGFVASFLVACGPSPAEIKREMDQRYSSHQNELNNLRGYEGNFRRQLRLAQQSERNARINKQWNARNPRRRPRQIQPIQPRPKYDHKLVQGMKNNIVHQCQEFLNLREKLDVEKTLYHQYATAAKYCRNAINEYR